MNNKRAWVGRATAVAAMLACTVATADVVVTGVYSVYPTFMLPGPGDTNLGGNTLGLGGSGTAQLLVNGGSRLSAASVRFADGGTGIATGLVTGAGSLLTINGNGNTNRLELGAWGQGSLTIADGATLDARADSAQCLLGPQWCHNFIGNAAGSDATLTITGAGSNASFLRAFVVGGLAVFRPPIETFTFGTPGGVTRGRVEVLAGGLLTSDGGSIGVAPGGSSPLGSERSFASVVVDGVGSVWRVTGPTLGNGSAFINLAEHANAWGTLDVTGGGQVQIQGRAGVYNGINVGSTGGRGDMRVAGAGSAVVYSGDAGYLQVGRNNATGLLQLQSGGQVSGLYYVAIGRDGGHGELQVDGAGSQLRIDGLGSAAANGVLTGPVLDIGRNGTGRVTVSNGGRIDLFATTAQPSGTALNIGREAASSGTLNISGAGSVVAISAASVLPGGGAGEAFNPIMRVGRDGSGFLNISAGGQLVLDGQAVSTAAYSRSTSLYIGGSSDTQPGGRGVALVTGAGSEIRLIGTDSYIGVGHGPQSFGQLTVADNALVSAIGMNVGRSGGVGMLSVDHASLSFSGQQTGSTLSGAFLSIGRSEGTGVATITNGSHVTLVNAGSAGASLNLGGTSVGPGGDGTLTLSGASSISIQAAPGLGAMTVGRDGTGLMRVKGGSSVDVAGGGIYVGRLSGSDGTLLISEGSSVSASWIGIGRNRSAGGGSVDGGTGTLVVNNSTLTADSIVIGTNGFLGGNGTLVGAVTNYGIFSPGNSPGQMRIDGSFTAEAGSRLIMEVQADGSGGWRTDSVVFGNGTALDLSHLSVEFRFLGTTDPNAFQASGGFNVDTFFQTAGGQGLDHQAFAGASFSARADAYQFTSFSFSANGGAVFTAAAVPEPGAGVMVLAGLAVLAGVVRRRR